MSDSPISQSLASGEVVESMPVYLVPEDDTPAVRVEKSVVLFGRHPDCDVVLLESKLVSRKHCCLVVVNNDMFVRDLGSMNGVRVNGIRVRRASAVTVGDELVIGDVVFQISSQPVANKPAPARNANMIDDPAADSGRLVAADLDLSQSMPVMIPDGALSDAEIAEIEESQITMSDDDIPFAGEIAPDSDDDVYLLEDS